MNIYVLADCEGEMTKPNEDISRKAVSDRSLGERRKKLREQAFLSEHQSKRAQEIKVNIA